jgi:hypothetical protein
MRRLHHVRHTFVALLVATALGAGCSSPPEELQTGVARIWVRSQGPGAEIARVVVTVSGGDGSDFLPIVAELARSGDIWIARIPAIPVGFRRFDAVAYDAVGVELYAGGGDAQVEARAAAVVSILLRGRPPPYGNRAPVIDSVAWSRDQVAPRGVVQLAVSSHDPDPGDDVTIQWLADAGAFDDPGRATPRWTAPAGEGIAHLSVTAQDDHGASTTFSFTIQVTTQLGDADVSAAVNDWPVIAGLSGAITVGATRMDADLSLSAFDPNGDPLTYDWTSTCPSVAIATIDPYGPTTPHVSLPDPAEACTVTVAVSDGRGPGGPRASLVLPPGLVSGVCRGVLCPGGMLCDPADGICKSSPGACQPTCAAGSCAPDGCGARCPCASGACDVATDQCVSCTPSCPAGTCGGDGCGGTCTCTAGLCNPATRTCVACLPSCTAGSCGGDGCGGTCTCTSGTCNAATGLCVAACVPSCPAGTCGPDGCGGTCACATGTCDVGTGLCSGPAAAFFSPVVARDVPLTPPAGLAMDAGGNAFVAGSLFATVDVDFQTRPVGPPLKLQSSGGADIVLARYDAAGDVTWAVAIGDDDPTAATDQTASGAAATADGRVAIIGKITGAVTFGASAVVGASPLPYVAAVSATDGSRQWGKGYNLGSNGVFRAVASSPGGGGAPGRIAVCGQANVRATALVGAGTYGGGNSDLVIAVFNPDGTKRWAVQLGGAGNESCAAVAVDDAGDVWATGQFDGASLSFPGGATVTSPGVSTRKWLWVAKLDGATGSALGAASFGSQTSGTVNPQAIAVASSGAVWVGGSFSGDLLLGAALSSAGGDDAFVAKLDGTTLLPSWSAVRFGGSGLDRVAAIAVTSTGDAIATGTVNPSSAAFRAASGGVDTTGAVRLQVAGATAPDLFAVRLDGASGVAVGAATWGDAATQTGDAIAVNRFGADQLVLGASLTGSASFGAAGALTATSTADEALVFGTVP